VLKNNCWKLTRRFINAFRSRLPWRAGN